MLIRVLCSLLICIVAAAPSAADSLDVATLYSPPLAFEQDGEVTGAAAEIVREGLRRMGHTANIVIMPWKRAVFMTRFGEVDALFYAVRNPEREQWFHYPDEPLVTEATVAVRRVGDSLHLTPHRHHYPTARLGVGRGYYYGPSLKHFLDTATFAAVEEATSIDSNFNKLIEDRIDVFLADLHLARHFLEKHTSRHLVEIITDHQGDPILFDAVSSHLVFSRETMPAAMAVEFSNVLKEMKEDGTYQHIFDNF